MSEMRIYKTQEEVAAAMNAQKPSDEAAKPPMINTRSFAKTLANVGFSEVHRGAEKLAIHMDTKVIHIPDQMEAYSPRNLMFQVAMAVMDSLGYSEIAKRVAVGSLYKNGAMAASYFNRNMPKLLNGMSVLPKRFEEAVTNGNLRLVEFASFPMQFASIIKGLNIPKIKQQDIVHGMFGKVTTPEGDIVDAPLSNFHWLVNSGEIFNNLLEAGCDPNHIWNADRIVRETLLEVNLDGISDLARVFVNSSLEADTLTIKVLNNTREIVIKYIDDPEPMPNDPVGHKVWTIKYGTQEHIFSTEQYVDGYGPINPIKAVYAMLSYVSNVNTEDQISGRIALSAPTMFRQPFYDYAHGDMKIKTSVKDAVGIWQIVCSRSDLSHVIQEETNPEIIAGAGAEYLNLGIPAITDAQVTRLYVKNGAIMRGFNLRWNDDLATYEVVNCNDQSKPGKFTNRGGLMTNWQAYVYANGTWSHYHRDYSNEPMTYGAKSILEPAGLRMVGTRGIGIPNDGIRCRVLLTNWVLENGSGVVSSHPNFKLQIGVRKKVAFTEVAVFCEGMDPQEHFNKYFKTVNVQSAVKPGQFLAWFKGVPICKFSQHEENLDGYGITGHVISINPGVPTNIQEDAQGKPISYDISGSISILMTYGETAAKMREAGAKWTCLPEELDIYTVDGEDYPQPDMVVGTENAKQDGNMLTLLKMWADTRPGGLDYNTATDLSEEDAADFEQWRLDNTKQLWIWTPPLQRSLFKALVREYGARTDFNFDVENRRVGQLCWCTEGDMVLSVEVSTVRENMGHQAVISEQLAALACIYRPFALDLWDGNTETRTALWSAMDMAISAPSAVTWVKGQENNPVIPFDQQLLEEKGPRAVFKKLLEEFPGGLTISDDSVDFSGNPREVALRFDALAKFSVGLDNTGRSVIQLLQHLTMANVENLDHWDNVVSRRIGMARGGVSKWAVSGGNARSMTRTDKILHGRKVKTTSRAIIKPGEVGLHPKDPLVVMYNQYKSWLDRKIEKLEDEYYAGSMTFDEVVEAGEKILAKRKGLTEGDHILISRSPMISVVLLKVVITDKAPIGTYLVSDWDWHRGNEGDGDGDPSAALYVPVEHLEGVRENLRSSYFGVQGYYAAWGNSDYNSLPIMDFYRGADKKATAYLDDNGNMKLVPHQGVNATPVAEAVDILKRVGNHYVMFVGKSFAMASAMTFKVEYFSAISYMLQHAEVFGLNDQQIEHYEAELQKAYGYGSACAKIWRRVYEGLALSGISAKAETFANRISDIGRGAGIILSQKVGDTYFDQIAEAAGLKFETFTDKDDPDTELTYVEGALATYVAFFLAGDSLSDGIQLTIDEAEAIYWAIRTTSLYSRIERMDAGDGTNMNEVFTSWAVELPDHLQEVLDDALVYGTLRRAGAGMSKRPGSNVAMVSLVDQDQFGDYLPGLSIMGSIFYEAGRFQAEAEDLRANMLYD